MYGTQQLINQNLAFYRAHYRLVAVGVCIVTAVIIGSLLVGSSVRQTLKERVAQRLGDTETVVFARQSYFSEEVAGLPLWQGQAKGVLMMDGFISSDGRLLPVMVWGTDDVEQGKAQLNPTLVEQLGEQPEITLRLPNQGMVPSGSLFVTKNYTTSIRLSVDGIRDAQHSGDLSLKNEQVLPMNIFVSRTELAETMEAEGMVNLVLSSQRIDEEALRRAWKPKLGGISILKNSTGWQLESKRVFIQQAVVEELTQKDTAANPLFSYLANSIDANGRNIPYSFVTAIREYDGRRIGDDEVILSDYAARRLNAKVGDDVNISYFLANDLKNLTTDSVTLRVSRIVPISEWVDDGALSADFPGLSDVKRCTDWDSDLPINMDLIEKEDEYYWSQYKSLPKALLPYDRMARLWHNSYGAATAIRFAEKPDMSGLTPEMMGIELVHPKAAGLQAATGGTDFSSLFLALGFFIILSALLLMVNPLSEMYEERKKELRLLSAMGFTPKRIQWLLARELTPVVIVSSIIGVLAGVLYTTLVMWLLGHWWSGVTGTSGFRVYMDGWMLLIGWLASVVIIGLVGYKVIRKALMDNERKHQVNRKEPHVSLPLIAFLVVLTVALFLLNIFIIGQSVMLFVLIGLLALITAALVGEEWLWRLCRHHPGFDAKRQTYGLILFNRRQAVLSYFALALGVFTVFAVGLNRQRFSDRNNQGAGHGYSLWCESSVPIYTDLNTKEGRAKLGLRDLPDDVGIVQALRYEADDASCLNLNKVENPTVLGLDIPLPDTTGVCIDEESLLWSMGKQPGDTLHYQNAIGETAALPIAASLPTGIFQGYALMTRSQFLRIWPDQTGTRLLLVKTSTEQTDEVRQLLSQALSEYGVRVMTVGERQEKFLEVVNTYLSIFLILGSIGMIVGIFSFVIVIRKNLLMRRNDIALYLTLGYSPRRIASQLFRENIIVPLYAILAGTTAAVVSVFTHIRNADLWTIALTLALLLLFVAMVVGLVRRECRKRIIK